MHTLFEILRNFLMHLAAAPSGIVLGKGLGYAIATLFVIWQLVSRLRMKAIERADGTVLRTTKNRFTRDGNEILMWYGTFTADEIVAVYRWDDDGHAGIEFLLTGNRYTRLALSEKRRTYRADREAIDAKVEEFAERFDALNLGVRRGHARKPTVQNPVIDGGFSHLEGYSDAEWAELKNKIAVGEL